MSRSKRREQPTPKPKIREMRHGDVAQVSAIEQASSATPWTRAMFTSEIGRPQSLDLVVVRSDEVLGYCMTSKQADVWHILNICVREDGRGQGLGAQLLDELFARADRRPHAGYTLEVRVSNFVAIRLYRRKGFLDYGVRPGYYSNNQEDALVMWRAGVPDLAR